jgi:hypothetical protein
MAYSFSEVRLSDAREGSPGPGVISGSTSSAALGSGTPSGAGMAVLSAPRSINRNEQANMTEDISNTEKQLGRYCKSPE